MPQHVLDQVVAHSELLAAMNALVSCVFDVRSCVTNNARDLWINLRAELASDRRVLAVLFAVVLHVSDAVFVVRDLREANDASELVAWLLSDF